MLVEEQAALYAVRVICGIQFQGIPCMCHVCMAYCEACSLLGCHKGNFVCAATHVLWPVAFPALCGLFHCVAAFGTTKSACLLLSSSCRGYVLVATAMSAGSGGSGSCGGHQPA